MVDRPADFAYIPLPFAMRSRTMPAHHSSIGENMKQDIHPDYHPVIFIDGDDEFITQSTLTSKETREIDGVKHHVVNIAISAASHPFWTGTQRIMDTEGRIERFKKKYGRT